jgi:hypothetical protein
VNSYLAMKILNKIELPIQVLVFCSACRNGRLEKHCLMLFLINSNVGHVAGQRSVLVVLVVVFDLHSLKLIVIHISTTALLY